MAGNTAGSASFSYDATGKTGFHQITVIIDPDNAITEQSENNNSASKTLGVQDANLWVSEQYFSPNGDGVKDGTQFFFPPAEPADSTGYRSQQQERDRQDVLRS